MNLLPDWEDRRCTSLVLNSLKVKVSPRREIGVLDSDRIRFGNQRSGSLLLHIDWCPSDLVPSVLARSKEGRSRYTTEH